MGTGLCGGNGRSPPCYAGNNDELPHQRYWREPRGGVDSIPVSPDALGSPNLPDDIWGAAPQPGENDRLEGRQEIRAPHGARAGNLWLPLLPIGTVFGNPSARPPLFGISALNLLSGKSWSHLWYLYAMMGIYLLLPMMKAYVATARRKDLQIFLIVLFAFTSCIPSFNNAMSTNVVTLIWIPCYVFYFFLGYYAFNFLELTRRLTLPCAVLVTLGCLVQTTYVLAGNYGEWVRSPASVFVFGLSLMVFLLFKKYFERPFEPDGVVALASSYSFGIYVIHPVFVNVAYKVIGLGPWSMPPVAFELSMWLFALLGSVLVVWIMRRIPGLRRIL